MSTRYIVLKNIVTVQISPTIEVPVNHCFRGAKGMMYSFSSGLGAENVEGMKRAVFKPLFGE